MPLNGCHCPWKVSQTTAMVVWFTVLVGYYALYIPVIQDQAVQAIVVVLYTVAAIIVTATYFVVRLTDPADQGCESNESSLYCDQCQAYVQQGTKHCKECQKCILGFDHHCKWVNNCIGSRNYRAFLALLTSMCSMMAIHLGTAIWLEVKCFSDTEAMVAQLAASYPTHIQVQHYEAALLLYTVVVAAALIPLGDLWLLHLVLACRGLTTWDYIMANRDAIIEPSALSRSVSRAVRHIKSLGPRSIRVHDESAAASQRRRVGLNPCLACKTDMHREHSHASQFEHLFKPGVASVGFDAALIFTPRCNDLSDAVGKTAAAGMAGESTQVTINLGGSGSQYQEPDEFGCVAADATSPLSQSFTTTAAICAQQIQQLQPVCQTPEVTRISQVIPAKGGVRFAE